MTPEELDSLIDTAPSNVTKLSTRRKRGGDGEEESTLNTREALAILRANDVRVFRDVNGRLYTAHSGCTHVVETTDAESFAGLLTSLCFSENEERLPADGVCRRLWRALSTQAGRAPPVQVFCRVASTPGHIWVDLADESGRVVDITPCQWRIVEGAECPVLFARGSLAKALPVPASGRQGHLEQYGKALGLEGEVWVACVSWLLSCYMPPTTEDGLPRRRGLLVFTGEHQVGKTTRAERLLDLVDPRHTPSGTLPEDARGLAIHVRERWVPIFDNVSGRPKAELSDALCRLVDGSGFSTRKLHTDDAEAKFAGSRACIITGIDAAPSRGDLASRAWRVELPEITERRTQVEIYRACAALAPGALGELLDAVAMALSVDGNPRLPPKTRLDAAESWAMGGGAALCWTEEKIQACMVSIAEAGQRSVGEGDPLCQAVLGMVADLSSRTWEGSSRALLDDLNAYITRDGRRAPDWLPRTPEGITRSLTRAAPGLRSLGCEYAKTIDSHTKRSVHKVHLPWNTGYD